METGPCRSRTIFRVVACGLGLALAVVAGTLAWIGTQSVVTCVAGAGLPVLFIVSTMVFSRDTSL